MWSQSGGIKMSAMHRSCSCLSATIKYFFSRASKSPLSDKENPGGHSGKVVQVAAAVARNDQQKL